MSTLAIEQAVYDEVLREVLERVFARMPAQRKSFCRSLPLFIRRPYQRLRHFLFGIHSWRSRRHKEFGYTYSYYVCRICNTDFPNHGK